MKILAVRSIPLSEETQDAWHSAGVKFLKREHGTIIPPKVAEKYQVIINLGNGHLDGADAPLIFNDPEMVWKIYSAETLRATLGKHSNFLPPYNSEGEHWHKQPGSKGYGKVWHQKQYATCDGMFGDVQQHIEGQEYRVITVGNKIVQAFKKDGDISEGFDFEWVGVGGISNNGIIPLVKEALDLVPGSDYSILAWDIIRSDIRPYIIEVNTSPGVNEPTAQRIVNQIERMI